MYLGQKLFLDLIKDIWSNFNYCVFHFCKFILVFRSYHINHLFILYHFWFVLIKSFCQQSIRCLKLLFDTLFDNSINSLVNLLSWHGPPTALSLNLGSQIFSLGIFWDLIDFSLHSCNAFLEVFLQLFYPLYDHVF